jgi:ribonucleotide reductase alpha subunit
VIVKPLVEDLLALGLWSTEMKNKIIEHGGSIQNIPEIPEDLRRLYRTVWDLPHQTIIDMAGIAGRGPYIDQSQSMNLYLPNDYNAVSNALIYGWRRAQLKTGMYYLRTKVAARAQQFTIVPSNVNTAAATKEEDSAPVCRRNDPTCTMCSS